MPRNFDYCQEIAFRVKAVARAGVRTGGRGKKGLTLLRHLLNEHGMNGADLSRILGTSRTVGPMILRQQRSITASHARLLGNHFGLPAGAFIA